jgi:hypothetical protein
MPNSIQPLVDNRDVKKLSENDSTMSSHNNTLSTTMAPVMPLIVQPNMRLQPNQYMV